MSFSKKDKVRVQAATAWVEGRSRNLPPPRSRYPLGGGSGASVYLTSGGIGAGSQTSPGSGNANAYQFDGTSYSIIDASDDPITIYNFFDQGIKTGQIVLCVNVGGYWFVVDVVSCSSFVGS